MNATLLWLRITTATVWGIFGVVKIFDLVPRHRLIVAGILGDAVSVPVTLLIGGAEVAMALWILSGIHPRTCIVVQTMVIATMNALEISMARDLLLAPVPMVLGNILLLATGWYVAIRSTRMPQVS